MGWTPHVSPLFAARECPGDGLLSEARNTREAHAARLDTALRAGATAEVSPSSFFLCPFTYYVILSVDFYCVSPLSLVAFMCRSSALLPPSAIFTLAGLIG